MRLRYRRDGDRLFLRIEDYTHDEARVWKMVQTMGVPLGVEEDGRALTWRRYTAVEAFPKLEKAAKLLRAQVLPEPGEPPLAAPSRVSQAYAQARPLDVGPVIEAAKADPHGGERALHDARIRLIQFMQERPTFQSEARAELRAVDQALEFVRERLRRERAVERGAEARELSQRLVGVSSEDFWKAHEALKSLREAARAAEATAQPAKRVALPETIPGFDGHLRPYQREGVEFLVARDLNAILADEMGLGKTVMTIAAVVARDARAFVVGPANVLYNWAEEVQRFTGEPARIYHRQEWKGPESARFLVTTYDALRTLDPEHEDIASRPVLILDEAHYVRNPETLRARLVKNLPQSRRILLTGTPLVNGIEDYYELLRYVDAGRWGSRQSFLDAWTVDPALFAKYSQVRSAAAEWLQRAARDVLLRRRKDEVLTELPPRTITITRHDLPADAERAYRGLETRAAEALKTAQSEVAIFAAIHALRQHIAEHRVPAVLERIRELLDDPEEAVVVYSQYLDPLHKLGQELGDIAAMIEGATPPRERLEHARRLGREGGPRVLLAQMEAGGIGLNFTGARHVLFLHLGWTPAAHAQAMDRVHRIGQDRPVFVEFFVTPNTIDERMVKLLLRKEADQNLVLSDESDVFNRAQLARLLAEDAAQRAEAEKRVAFG